MSVSVHLCDTCGRDDDSVIWNHFPTGSQQGSFARDVYVCGTCAKEIGRAVKELAKAMRARNLDRVPGRIPTVEDMFARWLKVLKP